MMSSGVQRSLSSVACGIVSPPRMKLAVRAHEEKKLPAKRAKTGFKVREIEPHFIRTNDEVHSSIELDPVSRLFLDTEFMQRLRKVKQLAVSEQTYLNTVHSRLEHSVGVAHLAELLCRRLQKYQPNLGIDEKDVLCVKLAGLFHDIGHSCFSHLFENVFPRALKEHLEAHPELKKNYEGMPDIDRGGHEEASLMMIDAMLESLGLAIDMDDLDKHLKQIGDGIDANAIRVYMYSEKDIGPDEREKFVLTSRDFVFIKEMIVNRRLGEPDDAHQDRINDSGYNGRDRAKEFLYMIVSNLFSGLDVDKVDYFARDARGAFRGSGEIAARFINEAFVCWAECPRPDKCPRCRQYPPEGSEDDGNHLMICYPKKMIRESIEFFRTRFQNHSSIYTHKTTVAAGFLVTDILKLADPFFRLPARKAFCNQTFGRDHEVPPSSLPMSRASTNPIALLSLNDSVIDQIKNTTSTELAPARLLVERYENRGLYKLVGEHFIDRKKTHDRTLWKSEATNIRRELMSLDGRHGTDGLGGDTRRLEDDDIIVEKRDLHYGADDRNPVLYMRFLDKREYKRLGSEVFDLPVAKEMEEEEHEAHLPRAFQECSIRVFCRDPSDEKQDLLRHVFELYCSNLKELVSSDSPNSTEDDADSDSDPDPVLLTQEEEGTANSGPEDDGDGTLT